MARLLLVRHADSVVPTVGGLDDDLRPLTDLGHSQAKGLVAELTAHSPTRIWSSPYLRAVQTIQPTADALGLPVEISDELREWRSGLGPRPDFAVVYRGHWDDAEGAEPDGESHQALTRRTTTAIRAAASMSGTTVLASHGTWVARALFGLGLPVDADTWLSMPMPAVYALDFRQHRLISATGPGLD